MTRHNPAQVVCFQPGHGKTVVRSPIRRGGRGLVHSNRKTQLQIVAFAAAMVMLVAACGGSSKKSNSSNQGGSGATVNTATVPSGGTLTIGAEQEPDCLDFLSSCARSSWGSWTAQIATLPMVFRTTPTQGQP